MSDLRETVEKRVDGLFVAFVLGLVLGALAATAVLLALR